MDNILLVFSMRKLLIAGLAAMFLGFQTLPASAWELSVPEDADALVRTYYNPKFGAFDVFLPASNNQRSWDIQDHGVFFLNVFCVDSKFLVTTSYLKWNLEKSEWEEIPFSKTKNLQIKFGTAKALNWSIKTQEGVGGSVVANPSLFVKKMSNAKTVSFPVRTADSRFDVKFNTKGFSKYVPDLRDAGC